MVEDEFLDSISPISMSLPGKPPQRVCSLVSPNVGETLRLYALEQEDAMRERLIAYRKQKEQEFERERSALVTDFELREWFATHHAELHAWEQALTAMTDNMQDQYHRERELNEVGEIGGDTTPPGRSQHVRSALEGSLHETRFKVEKDIIQKYEGRREVVKYLRHALANGNYHTTPSLALPDDPGVSTLLSGELEILQLHVNQLIDNINMSAGRDTRELSEHASKQWNTCISQLRKNLESVLAVQHRNRTTAITTKSSQRRKLLISIEKRIYDLRMFYKAQQKRAFEDSVDVYRTELLRLFAKYMYYMSAGRDHSSLQQLPPTARSLSGTNVLESIWAGKRGITSEYKAKFVESFLERVNDPILYQSLLDVLQYHII